MKKEIDREGREGCTVKHLEPREKPVTTSSSAHLLGSEPQLMQTFLE